MNSFSSIVEILTPALTVFAVLFSIFYILLRYLNRGVGNKESLALQERLNKQFEELQKNFEILRSHEGFDISDEERLRLIQDIQDRIRNEALDGFINDLQERVGRGSEISFRSNLIRKQKLETIERLKAELESLGRRGNLNLVIGVVAALMGLIILSSFALSSPLTPEFFRFIGMPSFADLLAQDVAVHAVDLPSFLMGYIPRLSLVVLIEVLAYFFLSLYKTSLNEVKYFQNEISSLEAKYLSLSLAIQLNDLNCINGSIEVFSGIERNFILNKGQTTLDLERDRLSHKDRLELMSTLSELLRRK